MALLLEQAMREQTLGKRTLARKIVEQSGGEIESWRSQIYRILEGQKPDAPTAIKIARAIGKPDGYLIEDDDPKFATALLGQVVALLEREPALRKVRPDLQRELAAQLRGIATRLEALATADQASGSPPELHG